LICRLHNFITAEDGLTFDYTYEYHYNGRLKSVTDSNARKISYDLYDPNGQKKQMSVLKGGGADERVINYDYDTANRPWKIKINGDTKIFTYAYDERGRRDTLDYPNGTTTDWDFDDLDRLTGITHRVLGGTTFATYGYPYHDQVGNITDVTGYRSATYFYDEIYRILNVVSTSPENFTYDDAGNRKTGPGPLDGPYVHNDANQITIGRKLDQSI
jgi:YD repeat-containing protein